MLRELYIKSLKSMVDSLNRVSDSLYWILTDFVPIYIFKTSVLGISNEILSLLVFCVVTFVFYTIFNPNIFLTNSKVRFCLVAMALYIYLFEVYVESNFRSSIFEKYFVDLSDIHKSILYALMMSGIIIYILYFVMKLKASQIIIPTYSLLIPFIWNALGWQYCYLSLISSLIFKLVFISSKI